LDAQGYAIVIGAIAAAIVVVMQGYQTYIAHSNRNASTDLKTIKDTGESTHTLVNSQHDALVDTLNKANDALDNAGVERPKE